MNVNDMPNDRENLAKWLRIASGLELLRKMAKDEKDPEKQDMLYNGLGQEECI
jgi:hypothetical protein